jgi:hypothetical protein
MNHDKTEKARFRLLDQDDTRQLGLDTAHFISFTLKTTTTTTAMAHT